MTFTFAMILPEMTEEVWTAVREAGGTFGLETVRGLEAADRDVRPGLSKFLSSEPGCEVVHFYSGVEYDGPSAFDLLEETILFRDHGRQPRIIPLLRALDQASAELGSRRHILICVEWAADDEIFYFQGGVEHLIFYIEAVQTLGMWLMSTGTGVIHGSNRYPLLFRFDP